MTDNKVQPKKQKRKKKVIQLVTNTEVDSNGVMDTLAVAKCMAKQYDGVEVMIVMAFADGDYYIKGYVNLPIKMAGLLELAKLEMLYPKLSIENDED